MNLFSNNSKNNIPLYNLQTEQLSKERNTKIKKQQLLQVDVNIFPIFIFNIFV